MKADPAVPQNYEDLVIPNWDVPASTLNQKYIEPMQKAKEDRSTPPSSPTAHKEAHHS